MARLRSLSRDELEQFVAENLRSLTEDECLAILEHPHCGTKICGAIGTSQRLTGMHAVRLRLVAHRQTPQAHAVKLVHYLYWFDLLRLSVDVQVSAPVRRAIDAQLLLRVEKLTLGERISSARACSAALIRRFLFDPHPRVFEALLTNKRLREEDLLLLAGSAEATPDQLRMTAEDPKWSYRRAVRVAIVTNPKTPRAVAATQLPHLTRAERQRIHARAETSVYIRRCIERLEEKRRVPGG